MKRTIAFLSAFLLLGLMPFAVFSQPPSQSHAPMVSGSQKSQAAPQGAPAGQAPGAAKGPQWKSRAEYDGFQAIMKAATPQEKVSAADAFLQKYPTSDFKAQADLMKLQADLQLRQVDQAIAVANDALHANPNNGVKLTALNYLAYVFPYIYKPGNPNASSQLSQAQSQAKDGLQLLQQVQKPANASQEAFDTQVKQFRSHFNRALGFVALQQKDYASALTYLKAAAEDDPSDSYTFSFIGQAYLYLKPVDYNSAIWYLARAVSLAQQAHTPNLPSLQKFYSQVYESRHGSNAGEQDLVTQAANTVNPPSGFSVAPPPKHSKTGNPNVDAFYGIQDALAVGGDQAQTAWSGLKGQPLGIVAFVEGVAQGNAPGTYAVRADVLPQDRGKDGDYNLQLQTDQADAKYLRLGDPIRFQGTITAYTATPNFVLTLANVKIDDASLRSAAERAKAAQQGASAHRHAR